MKVKGSYHSPLRQSQSAATRERIVKACVTLMQLGADLTYAAVAATAEVQERTVYRHFPRKEDLEAALQRNVDTTRELGFVKNPIDINKYADLSLVRDAAKRLK